MKPALLVLESGRVFQGESFGSPGEIFGEVVFNTSMTGYQEILTDPSYQGQIVVMTYPHIGNTGINFEDEESQKVFLSGFAVRELSPTVSNWRARTSLAEYLAARGIPGITGIDTRSLVRHLRDKGAMRGGISTLETQPRRLLRKVKASPEMSGQDLVPKVTCDRAYDWIQPEWRTKDVPKLHKIVVIDFGVKHNILRCLTSRGCGVRVVPGRTTAEEILALEPDGILLSNGPGDPSAVHYGIETVQHLIHSSFDAKRTRPLPILGICLGHQILGLALGGKSFKLPFGHHGANHPVKDLTTGEVKITTQNHGFSIDADSLAKKNVEVTHVNLNDKTCEGLRVKSLPIFSVQHHPEASGGPHDSRNIFDRFVGTL